MKRLFFTICLLVTAAVAFAAQPIDEIAKICDELELNEERCKNAYFSQSQKGKSKDRIAIQRYIEFEDPDGSYYKRFSDAIIRLRSNAKSFQVYTDGGKRSYQIVIEDSKGKTDIYLFKAGRSRYTIQYNIKPSNSEK